MQKKLVIFGGSGFVGSYLVKDLKKDFKVLNPKSSEVDVTNYKELKSFLTLTRPNIVINSAAIARMEECEENPEKAYLLNSTPSQYMVKILTNKNALYYYISTGAVYDGIKSSKPFKETLEIKPISVYAKTKAKGEAATLSYARGSVLRISFPYVNKFAKKSDMLREMVKSIRNNNEYNGITDQIINPLSLLDDLKGIGSVVRNNAIGLYNIAAVNSLSNYEFLVKAAKLLSLDFNKIKKITFQKFLKGKKAFRSKYSVLDVEKFNKDFYPLPTVEKSLESLIDKFAI